MSDLNAAYNEVLEAIKPAVNAAYKKGYDAGFKAAQDSFMHLIASINTDNIPASELIRYPPQEYFQEATPVAQQTSDERATPGTVKPTIIKLLSQHPDGLTTKQITNMTGIKPNSVRGTLWTLQQEGAASKSEGGLYRALENNSGAGDDRS